MGLTENIEFVGPIPQNSINRYYQEADALIFPGLRNSGGSSLLDAMSKGLPVIYLDCSGPPDMVGDDAGIKIPVSSPSETLRAMADAFESLANDPQLRTRLGRNAYRAARMAHFNWTEKGILLKSTYARLLGDCIVIQHQFNQEHHVSRPFKRSESPNTPLSRPNERLPQVLWPVQQRRCKESDSD